MSDSDDASLPAIDAEAAPDGESADELSFLLNLDADALGPSQQQAKARKPRPKPDLDDVEQAAAARRFKAEEMDELQGSLPIKTPDGRVVPNEASGEASGAALEPKKLSKKELRRQQRQKEREKEKRERPLDAKEEDEALLRTLRSRFDDKDLLSDDWVRARKLELGLLCDGILQNPDAAFSGRQGEEDKMQRILQLGGLLRRSPVVSAVAMISATAVFVDVLPDYRIRLPSEKELEQKVSKEVRKTWRREAALLKAYQQFLQLLSAGVTGAQLSKKEMKRRREGVNGKTLKRIDGDADEVARLLFDDDKTQVLLASQALSCLCELMRRRPFFNFRKNIIKYVCKALGSPVRTLRKTASNALGLLLETNSTEGNASLGKTDEGKGEALLEAIRGIHSILKQLGNATPVEVLSPLLRLVLRVSEEEGQDLKAKAMDERKKKRKQRKKEKEAQRQDAEADMRETDATISRAENAKLQVHILEEVLVIYFRVLKHNCVSALLPLALRGLAKLAHLINIDTAQDVVRALRDASQAESIGILSAFHCVFTAFTILEGPGAALNVDNGAFLTILAGLLEQLPHSCFLESTNPSVFARYYLSGRRDEDLEKQDDPHVMALRCMEMAFQRRKEPSSSRVFSMVKTLLCTALHVQYPASAAFVACARTILQRYPTCQAMLELGTEEGTGAGYGNKPLGPDPVRGSNKGARRLGAELSGEVAWELNLLRFAPEEVTRVLADLTAKQQLRATDRRQVADQVLRLPALELDDCFSGAKRALKRKRRSKTSTSKKPCPGKLRNQAS